MDTDQPKPTLRQRAQNLWQHLRLRRREPWNWLTQTASAAFLPPGLLFHSPALIALSALGFIAGCLPLPLPPMRHTGLRALAPRIETLIGLESAWLARPLDARRKRGLFLLGLCALATAGLLWVQDLGPIGLGIVIWYLLRVRRHNIEDGIAP